jgi:hypothetical protein
MRIFVAVLSILAMNEPEGAASNILYISRSRIVGQEDLQEVFRVDLDEMTFRRFYYVDPPAMPFRPAVSPARDLIAIPCLWGGNNGFAYVDIVDAHGRRVDRIQDASPSLAWNADGSELVYVSVSLATGEEVPTGVKIYKVRERTSEEVYDVGYHLTWAHFDGNIYISMRENNPPILKLDRDSLEVVSTEYDSLQFSPDGKYYFTFGGDNRNELVLREDRINITDAYAFLQQKENFGHPEWLSKDVVRMGAQAKAYHEYLFFCETGRAYMAQGLILALGEDGESVYVSRYPDGAIDKMSFDKLDLKSEGESPEVIQARIEALRKPPAVDQSEEHGESTDTEE